MQLRNRLLFFCLLALAALLVLAAGLGNLKFQPGRSAAGRIPVNVQLPLQGATEEAAALPFWKQALFAGVFLMLAILSIWMLPPEVRKRLLWQLIRLCLAALLLIYLIRNHYLQLPNLNFDRNGDQTGADLPSQAGVGITAFHPPALMAWMDFLIALGLLLALAGLGWVGLRYWRRLRARTARPRGLDEIASIARSSLAELASGGRLEDVIIQSYTRMSMAVAEKRGLKRGTSVTPREFAGQLEYAGLPADSVQRLTRLFEAVRYGARPSSQAEVHEAMACLHSILAYCGAAE